MTTQADTTTRRQVLAGAAVAALAGAARTLTTPALAQAVLGPVNIDSTGELIRAVHDRIDGATFALEEVRSRAWASVTFRGARHGLTFRLDVPTQRNRRPLRFAAGSGRPPPSRPYPR